MSPSCQWYKIILDNKRSVLAAILLISTSFAFGYEESIYSSPEKRVKLQEKINPISKLKFDEANFELAYKTFLFSGNVNDAYALATAAVKQKPKLIIWHERLAQTAIWTNHSNVAMREILYLIDKNKGLNLLSSAINLAKGTNHYSNLITLLNFEYKRNPHSETLVLDLADAYDKNGQPESAIKFLTQQNRSSNNKKFLDKILFIYQELGDEENVLKIANMLDSQYGPTEKTALLRAEIHYNHFDLKTALKDLQQFSATANPETLSNDFLLSQAKLSWIIGSDVVARQSYFILYHRHALDSDGLQRLFNLQPSGAERVKLSLALAMWQRDQNTLGFLTAAEIALSLREWDTLYTLYHSPMPEIARETLSSQLSYWQLYSLYLQHAGENQIAREFMLQGLLSHPQEAVFQKGYLSFLLNQTQLDLPQQDINDLFYALAYYQHYATSDEEWANIYISAFTMNNELEKAGFIYQKRLPQELDNQIFLTNYADYLSSIKYQKSALLIQSELWRRLQIESYSQPFAANEFWNTYVRLARLYAPASTSYPLAANLAQEGSPDALLVWAVDHGNDELANYLLAYYYPLGAPAWAVLRLALIHQDQVKIAKITHRMGKALPMKDRISAADQIGELGHAQTLAFRGLQQSNDSELYKQFTDLMLQSSNQVLLQSEYEQFGNMQGPREVLNTKLLLEDQWFFTPYLSIWDAYSNNTGNLASHSYLEKLIGASLSRQTNRWSVRIEVGNHQALYNSYQAILDGSYQLTSRTTLEGRLAYNQRSTIGVFMLYAGSQDNAIGIMRYQLSMRDTVIGSLELDKYYLQDRTALGSGSIMIGEYDHRFRIDYPDITLILSGSLNGFNSYNTAITGRAVNILPVGSIATPATFLSKGFWQAGANLSIGESFRNEYSHAWRPYINAGLLYASTGGYGRVVDVGYGGMVLGRDKLNIYFTQTNLNTGQSQTNFIFGIKYVLNF